MINEETIREKLNSTFNGVDVNFLGNKYGGKVRDCYVVKDKRILITSDRLSAFDRVLTTIPFKGEILTKLANFWFKKTKHIVKNHIISYPHPNVLIAKEINMLPVEVIVRGYLTGSALRDYNKGLAISGIKLPEGLKKSEKLPSPIITPSTKAEKGLHDEPISSEEIVSKGLVEKELWENVCKLSLKLFECGRQHAESKGLILVDTKYEFGYLKNEDGSLEIIIADEIHTQDSSRYWIKDSYLDSFNKGEEPKMLDKEFVRSWLMDKGYMGEGTPPEFSDDFRVEIAKKYIEAYEKITGEEFIPDTPKNEIKELLKNFV